MTDIQNSMNTKAFDFNESQCSQAFPFLSLEELNSTLQSRARIVIYLITALYDGEVIPYNYDGTIEENCKDIRFKILMDVVKRMYVNTIVYTYLPELADTKTDFYNLPGFIELLKNVIFGYNNLEVNTTPYIGNGLFNVYENFIKELVPECKDEFQIFNITCDVNEILSTNALRFYLFSKYVGENAHIERYDNVSRKRILKYFRIFGGEYIKDIILKNRGELDICSKKKACQKIERFFCNHIIEIYNENIKLFK
jgi:hypothetical protein